MFFIPLKVARCLWVCLCEKVFLPKAFYIKNKFNFSFVETATMSGFSHFSNLFFFLNFTFYVLSNFRSCPLLLVTILLFSFFFPLYSVFWTLFWFLHLKCEQQKGPSECHHQKNCGIIIAKEKITNFCVKVLRVLLICIPL